MRTILMLGLSCVVACGITFSPGDFSAPGETAPVVTGDAMVNQPDTSLASDGGTEAAVSTDGGPTIAGHVLLFGGTKDREIDSNDVWLAPIDANGAVGAFAYLQPTPLVRPLQAATITGGRVLAVVQGPTSRVVESADFDSGITSAWSTATVPNPPTSSYGTFFAKTSLIVVGGQTSEQVDDGTGTGGTITVTTNHDELYVNKASGTTFPAPNNAVSTTKLPAGIFAPTSVLYKDFAFVWGQGDKADQPTKIYGGKVDETAGLASVSESASFTVQGAQPSSPIACAGEGRLFVTGGTNSVHTYSTDINESTGALGTWKNGPDLPAMRSAAGCAVIKGWLYIFGGRLTDKPNPSGSTLSNQILRSKISSDGSMGEWETTAQTLISPRANVFALTY